MQRLLVRPYRRLEGRIRLPEIQHIGRDVSRQMTASMMTRDSLRLSGTSRAGIITGPLAPVQIFATQSDPGEMFVNSEANMTSGLLIGNARRLVTKTRGQSAGV